MKIYWKSVSEIEMERWVEDLWVKDLVKEVIRLRRFHQEDGRWTDELNAEIRKLRGQVKSLIVATQMKDDVIRELNEKLDKLKEKYGDLDF